LRKLVFAIIIFSFIAMAKEPVDASLIAEKFVRTALREQKAYQWLRELTSIGGRLAGSENSAKAVRWAKEKMEQLGFDRVYLQPVEVPRWERGNVEKAVIISPENLKGRELSIAALGGSVGTPEEGITAEVIEVKNFEEFKEKAPQVRGKIVFFNVPMDQGEINTFKAYGEAVRYRWAGAMEGAKAGAKAVIIRSITTRYDNVPHTGMMGYDTKIRKIPAVSIGLKDADFLNNALKKYPHLKITLKLNCRQLPPSRSYNVIGEIRGLQHPEEVIVVGGHLDSWDKGEGAHDDGAGVVQSIEAVELFKRIGIRPERTLRVVLFMNEEYGLSGAKVYGEYVSRASEKHIAAIESDRGGFTPRGFTVKAEDTVFKEIKSWLPVLQKCRIDWIRKGGGGADISRIKAKALIGYFPDDQRYFDFHHSANDVFEAVNPRELELGSAAIATLLYLISCQGL